MEAIVENTERLLGLLLAQYQGIERQLRDITDRQLEEIKRSQERLAESHEKRLLALEINYASASGGMRMMLLLCGTAATLGGLVASLIPHLWGHP